MADKTGGLSGASDRIRETAKWFAVSVAALGGVVVAGSQLTDIGKLDVDSGRLWLAVAGGVLALIGALVILWVVVDTMTGEAVSLHGIVTQTPDGAADAIADTTLLAPYSTVMDVETEYKAALTARKTAYEAARANPGDNSKITVANLADNRFVAIDQVVGPLLEVVSYQHLAHSWKNARLGILAGAVVGTLGLGLFAWAANPPPDAAASMAAANVLSAPNPGKVQLTAAGKSVLEESLGTSCWVTPSAGGATTPVSTSPTGSTGQPTTSGAAAAVSLKVLVLATTDAGPDVLIEQPGCNRVRVLLGSDWGTLTK